MAAETGSIRIVVISGSARPGNYTAKATALLVDELKKHPEVSGELIDPSRLHLPIPGTVTGVAAATEEIQRQVKMVEDLRAQTLDSPGRQKLRALGKIP